MYISTLQTKTSLGACRKCLCWLPGLSGSLATSSTPTGQPGRKPAGQMYSASGAVRSAVADQQIGDDAVTRRRRLVGKRRAGTATLDHVDSYTSWHWACTWLAVVHRANAAQCEEAATSLARTSLYRWPLEPQRSTLVATCLSSLLAHTPRHHYSNRCAMLRMQDECGCRLRIQWTPKLT